MKPAKTRSTTKLVVDYWKTIGEPLPNPKVGVLWEVECHECGLRTTRTTRQININSPKCNSQHCRGDKTSLQLSYKGQSLTLTQWAGKYPCINLHSARNYSSRRFQGLEPWATYTDAQVLFGKAGRPRSEVVPVAKKEAKEALRDFSKEANDFILYVASKIQFQALESTRNGLVALLKDAQANAPTQELAGGNYELQGSLIQELYEQGMLPEIRAWLKEEVFETVEDKEDALHPYIPVDTTCIYITELEIMALCSIIDMEY